MFVVWESFRFVVNFLYGLMVMLVIESIKFLVIYIGFLERNFLDYLLNLMEILDRNVGVKRRFKFLNVFVDYGEFLIKVVEVWVIDINGIVMFKVWGKLKVCIVFMKFLLNREIGNILIKIEIAR